MEALHYTEGVECFDQMSD